MSLDARLARAILDLGLFTADDVTANGSAAVDPDHAPNAAQNSIGALFNRAARDGRIAWTGRVVRSRAPHRKGGAIRVWRATAAGETWARSRLVE